MAVVERLDEARRAAAWRHVAASVGIGRAEQHERRGGEHGPAARRRGGRRFLDRTRSAGSGVQGVAGRRGWRSSARRPRYSWTHVYTRRSCERARAAERRSGRMNFAFTEEQDELRKTVRAFLDSKSPEAAVRELMETEDGYDEAVWKQMAEQLGLQGLAIPEEFGGSRLQLRRARHRARGDGPLAAHAPRSSRPSCWPPTRCCTAATTRPRRTTCRASPAARRSPPSPSPSRRASGTRPASRSRPRQSGDGWTLSGTKSFVLDGHTANLIIVAARTGKGVSLFAVDGDADGPHPHVAVDDGPDPQAGQARVRRHARPR